MSYPTLRPTTREFIPPPLPVSTTNTMNQRVVRSLLASKPGKGTLNLSYENITDQQALSFVTNYEASKGQTVSVTLPSEVISGLGPDFATYIRNVGSDLTWRWDGPPKLDSVQQGLTTVSVALTAYVNPGTLTRPADAPLNPYEPPNVIDTTKYPSFNGGTITPPTPPTPGQGKKWISYNQELELGGQTSTPSYDSAGNIYIARSTGGKLSVSKFNPSGGLLWRRTVELTNASSRFPNYGVPQRFINLGVYENILAIYVVFEVGNSGTDATFALLGFTLTGNLSYFKRYPFVVAPVNVILHGVTGKIIILGHSNNSVQDGFTLLAFTVSDGVMDKRVTVAATSSANTSNYYLPGGLFPKPNGGVVLRMSGGSFYPILVEVDSTLSTVIASRSYLGINPGNLCYRPDTGGYLGFSSEDCLVYLDDSFQVLERRSFVVGNQNNAIGYDTNYTYAGNGYFYATSRGLSASGDFSYGDFMVARPISGRTITKYNWDMNTIEYATFVTDGTITINPAAKRIYATELSPAYTWLRMAELELPTTTTTITTTNPPNVSLTSVSAYLPAFTSVPVTKTIFQYYVPFQCSNVAVSGTIAVSYDTYMDPIEMDIVNDYT